MFWILESSFVMDTLLPFFRSDKDEVEQLLADVEEKQGFHTVRK